MQVLASQLHFLANRNAGLAIPPLFWPVNCIKIWGHVALLSGPTVYSLYCAKAVFLLLAKAAYISVTSYRVTKLRQNVVYLFSIYHGEVKYTPNLGNYQADMTISPTALNQ